MGATTSIPTAGMSQRSRANFESMQSSQGSSVKCTRMLKVFLRNAILEKDRISEIQRW